MARSPLRSHPPAWYRDPHDARRVRRWDGHAWTDEVRPIPDWLRTVRLSAGPGGGHHRVPLGARRLWLVSAALLSLGAAVMVLLSTGRADDADRVGDTGFARAAQARCARTNLSARHLDGVPAARAEELATAWEATVADLKELPVASADVRRVERWFEAWDRWVVLGHDYADALDRGDTVEADAVVAASDGSKAAITRFALVNAMPDCAFR